MLAAPASWILFFLLIPLVFVAAVGLATVQPNYLLSFSELTLEHYATVFDPTGEPFHLLGRSLWIAFVATAMSLAVGYTVAYYIARLAKEKWRGVLMALIVIPFWISFIVRIYGVKLFVQPGGYIDLGFQAIGLPGAGQYFVANFGLNTDPLLIFTLVYVWLPFMVLPLFTSLSRVDAQLLEAAYDLGATRLRAFWSVTLPLTLPGIVTGSIFVFITTLGSFVEPNFLQMQTLMIGNYVDTQYNQTQGVGVPLGAAASVFIIVSTMLLITIYARSAEAEESGVYAAKGKPRPMSLTGRYTLLLLAASVLSPLAVAGVVRTVWAPSVVAVADLALVAAVLLAVTAHALIEAEVRRHKPPDRVFADH